jgi:hypothetical protein
MERGKGRILADYRRFYQNLKALFGFIRVAPPHLRKSAFY